MRGALRIAFGALAATLLLGAAQAHAQASEEAVKAAFLPKFVRYIEYPETARPEAGQPFYLCIVGHDPFGAAVDRAAASENVEGHAIAVRRFADADAPAVAGCHAAFVADTDEQRTLQILTTLRRQATLTITDSRWSKARGMIHFAILDGRVRFYIDDAAAGARGITISSRLLALAVEVKQRDQ